MGELILLGLGTYFGVMAAVWMVSTAFADGGVWGVILLIAWIFFWMWIASETCGDKKK